MVADVSRLHAALSRDGEGYVLEAVRAIPGERPASDAGFVAARRPGDAGGFLPVPISPARARQRHGALDLVSGHRLPLGVDGVLVMAETLVMGSGDAGPCDHTGP